MTLGKLLTLTEVTCLEDVGDETIMRLLREVNKMIHVRDFSTKLVLDNRQVLISYQIFPVMGATYASGSFIPRGI